MSDLGAAVVQEVRHRVVNHFPGQVRECLEALSEDQIWWRPNPKSNSVGNLVLHVCGSTRHFLGRGVGGSDYRRDRPGEFSESGPLPKPQLLALLDETADESARVLDGLDPGGLLAVSDRAGDPHALLVLLLRVSHHWAVHAGQIVYATKAIREGVFSDLWNKTPPRP